MDMLELVLAMSRNGKSGGSGGGSGSGGGGSSAAVKPYELIERVTISGDSVFERTREPSGTSYNFKAIKLKCTNPSTSQTVTFYASCDTEDIGSIFNAPTASAAMFGGEFYLDHGWWTVRRLMNANLDSSQAMYNGGAKWEMTHSEAEYPIITRIRSGICKSGTVIEIWGIRA